MTRISGLKPFMPIAGCKVMDYAQAYTALIDWVDYGEAREKIELDYANRLPDEGLPIFNRVLRALVPSDLIR